MVYLTRAITADEAQRRDRHVSRRGEIAHAGAAQLPAELPPSPRYGRTSAGTGVQNFTADAARQEINGGGIDEAFHDNGGAGAGPPSDIQRLSSVEDELWGWFGDDRPMETGGVGRAPRGLEAAAAATAASNTGQLDVVAVEAKLGAPLADAADLVGGGEMDITVSTVALSERLTKLSAGRTLLAEVRAECDHLVRLVSAAARDTFVAEGAGGSRCSLRATCGVEERMVGAVDAAGGDVGLAAIGSSDNVEQGSWSGLRQGVVAARSELEGLQRDIRRLAKARREGARDEVSVLVGRRTELASAALPSARKMAQRLLQMAATHRVRARPADGRQTAGRRRSSAVTS